MGSPRVKIENSEVDKNKMVYVWRGTCLPHPSIYRVDSLSFELITPDEWLRRYTEAPWTHNMVYSTILSSNLFCKLEEISTVKNEDALMATSRGDNEETLAQKWMKEDPDDSTMSTSDGSEDSSAQNSEKTRNTLNSDNINDEANSPSSYLVDDEADITDEVNDQIIHNLYSENQHILFANPLSFTPINLVSDSDDDPLNLDDFDISIIPTFARRL